MVHVKTAASLVLAAAAIAPAVAYPYYDADDSLVTREDNDIAGSVFSRRFTAHRLEEREDLDELMARDPFLGFNHLKKWIRGKKAAAPDAGYESAPPSARELEFDEDLFTRELEELEELMERDPILGFKHLKKWLRGKKTPVPATDASAESAPPAARELEFDEDIFTREFDELMEREPILGFKHLRKWLGGKKQAPAAEGNYESPPLVAREYDDEVVFSREYDELEAREPGFLTWIKGIFHPKKKEDAKKKAEAAKAAEASSAEAAAPEARDYDELLERYFEDLQERELAAADEDLMAREPFLGINHLKKWIRGKKQAAAPVDAEAPVAREYDELLEREFYDDLD